MNDVIVDSMQYMTDDDLKAMAAYLKSLAPHKPDAPQYAYDVKVADQLYHGHPADEGARIYID